MGLCLCLRCRVNRLSFITARVCWSTQLSSRSYLSRLGHSLTAGTYHKTATPTLTQHPPNMSYCTSHWQIRHILYCRLPAAHWYSSPGGRGGIISGLTDKHLYRRSYTHFKHILPNYKSNYRYSHGKLYSPYQQEMYPPHAMECAKTKH